jgi:hypothetical protein
MLGHVLLGIGRKPGRMSRPHETTRPSKWLEAGDLTEMPWWPRLIWSCPGLIEPSARGYREGSRLYSFSAHR